MRKEHRMQGYRSWPPKPRRIFRGRGLPGYRFAMVSREFINDARLSNLAVRIHLWALGQVDHWQVNAVHLNKMGFGGVRQIRNAFAELEELGYLHREKIRTPEGRWEYIHEVFEVPVLNPHSSAYRSDLGRPSRARDHEASVPPSAVGARPDIEERRVQTQVDTNKELLVDSKSLEIDEPSDLFDHLEQDPAAFDEFCAVVQETFAQSRNDIALVHELLDGLLVTELPPKSHVALARVKSKDLLSRKGF